MYIRDFRLQNIQQWMGNYFWIVYDLSKWLHVQQGCSHESSSLPGSCYASSFFYFCYFQDTSNASDLGFLSHESWVLLLYYAWIKKGLQLGASNSGSMSFVPLQKEFSTSVISCRIYLSHTVIYRKKESTLFVIAHMVTHSYIARGTYTFKMIKIYTHI